jgi:cell division protein FtsW
MPGTGIGFQPVEIVKVGILFYISWLIQERKRQRMMDTRELWIPVGTLILLTGIFVAFGLKDFGSTVVIFAMVCAMLFIGGVNLKQFALGLGALALLAGLLIVMSPHRRARIASFGDNYHVENALISLGTGGLFGVGIGNSIQATGYLPEALSDSIIAIIGEVTGFIGAIGVILLFAMILVRMIGVSKRTEDNAQALYVVGVAAWIFAHVIINVGGMIGLIPVKGITLPFLSYGGTSMLFVSFALGMVLQISSWTKREVVNEDSGSRRGQWRARNAGHRRS